MFLLPTIRSLNPAAYSGAGELVQASFTRTLCLWPVAPVEADPARRILAGTVEGDSMKHRLCRVFRVFYFDNEEFYTLSAANGEPTRHRDARRAASAAFKQSR